MATKIDRIKSEIQNRLGSKCSIIAKQGRKKIIIKECIIDAAYSEIFVVKCLSHKSIVGSTMTFSYIDVFTKAVCLFNYNEEINSKII